MIVDAPLLNYHALWAKRIVSKVKSLDIVELPHYVISSDSSFHIFVDASSKAFGIVAYSVGCINNASHILTGKVRIALCKNEKLTIPKLKLASLLLGTHLSSHFCSLIVFCSIYVWC